MRRISLVWLMGVLLSFNALADTGGWTSGGGNILRNANNPWFLKNTTEVTYCILADQQIFGDVPASLPDLVARALSYWKEQLADPYAISVQYPFGPGPDREHRFEPIRIGTQTFSFRSTCDGSEDIVFQFGVLNAEQKQYLGDPTRLVGVAVRTAYDEVNLRGKGFIYISPDSGSLRYHGDHLRERAWHEGKAGLLFRAIAHEVGHVFGLPHGGEGLMAETYSETILLKKEWFKPQTDDFELPSFFHFEVSDWPKQSSYAFMLMRWNELKDIFGIEFTRPMRPTLKARGSDAVVMVSFHNDDNTVEDIELGTIRGTVDRALATVDMGITIFLTEKQAVFPPEASQFLRLRGPRVSGLRIVGTFTPANPAGKSFQAILTMDPASVVFDGIVDGAFKSNIFSWLFSDSL